MILIDIGLIKSESELINNDINIDIKLYLIYFRVYNSEYLLKKILIQLTIK